MGMKRIVRNPYFIASAVLIALTVFMTVFSPLLPPVVTVESGSMQHSSQWMPGIINTGDLVLEKEVDNPVSAVTTYVVGRTTGYSTYGDYGNVIFYHSPDNLSIVHRAMFYLSWNNGMPQVAGYTNQSWIRVTQYVIVISDVGYSHRNLVVPLEFMANESGFVTMGDHNLAVSDANLTAYGGYAASDQSVFGYSPITPDNVTGIAFGQIPWGGLVKLNILRTQGQWPYYNDVPQFAYMYLAMASIGTVSLLVYLMVAVEKHEMKKKDE